MARIVIIGAGIGGIPMALESRDLLGEDHRITVISDSDTFKFTPSNPWVAVNWRKKEQIEINLTSMFEKKGIEFITVSAIIPSPPEPISLINSLSTLILSNGN